VFSQDAKDEIARVAFERECCPTTFMQTLLRFHGRRPIATERGPVVRAVLNAAHRAGIDAFSSSAPSHRPGQRWRVSVARTERLRPRSLPPAKACCRRAWLRAAFLSCGSVSDPTRGYHLEFSCRDDATARLLCDGLAALQIDAGLSRRRRRPLVYIKDAQTVSTLLGHLGASSAVLQLEAQRALRQTKNSIRCAVNGETANAARSASVAARQQRAALRMLRNARHASVSRSIREAAKLRIAHPESTLRELAAFARPPITKAAMASRLRLLERIAKR
jgi:DNA-binding protein WhiA